MSLIISSALKSSSTLNSQSKPRLESLLIASLAFISDRVSRSVSRSKYKLEYKLESILKSKLVFKEGVIG